MTMAQVEKKWWFILPVSMISTMLTIFLLRSAGAWPADGLAHWLVYFFCLLGIWKAVSFLGWLIVLFAKPSSTALD